MIYTNDIIKKQYAKRKKISNIIRIITFPFILLFVLLAVYIGFSKFVKKENSVNIFGYRLYIVSTGSMQPNYNVGDLILIKETPKGYINKNDVITFSVGNTGETVTHRVVDIIEEDGKTYYKTKGDNNQSEDTDLIEFSNVKGKIVYKINNIGMVIANVTNGFGPLIILVIAIMGYIHTNHYEEKRIAREIARRRYNIPRYKREEKYD